MKVILLKNKTTPSDPYDRIFQQHNYEPIFLPLLRHTPVNEQIILSFLTSDDFLDNYEALIITSQRSIETLGQILAKLHSFGRFNDILSKPSYTVGPATAHVMRQLGFTDVRGGDDAGNGQILADIIKKELRAGRVLFLTGQIRKDTIPRELKLAGFDLKELVSYRTEPLTDIVDRYTKIVSRLNKNDWLVFFSPQGTRYILDHLDHFSRLATIGPTTQTFLARRGIGVDVVAKKPCAESLYQAIVGDELSHSQMS
ncbi:DEKNAAC105370 [Brettanomyces naardenensis]|uniref:DEKNAAC105370 n=1 Tax=Brettanomyces naardenensis TaxID=13370 RepID=A0A448YTA6_BRENA|nr:DEKNAAC105370 [Brettanomyces naardenensis]